MGVAAARGGDASALAIAVDRALIAASTDAMPPRLPEPVGLVGDDAPLAEPGVVLVRLPLTTPYVHVAAELKYLAGARGVTRVNLRRVSPGGWVIGVTTTESPQRIANIAKKAPTSDTVPQVRLVGELVELVLQSAPP
jgi:hypothetical protein